MYCQLQTKTMSSLLIALYGFQLLIYATSIELERNCALKLKKVIQGVLSGEGIRDVVEIKACFLGKTNPGGEIKEPKCKQQECNILMYVGGTRTTKQLGGYG